MTAKLLNSPPKKKNNLPDFPENVLGVIEEWGPHNSKYAGLIVVRHGKKLSSLTNLTNKNIGHSWLNLEELYIEEGNYQIRILERGEKVVVEV